ncbi:MAG: hypothetical protein BWY46_01199 [Firmicutes bacterium ADurb.Bin300]|nr:MAG: hypothetical protein BWY46_01199 [Firmicutes bacterium ADurb.Bin300]
MDTITNIITTVLFLAVPAPLIWLCCKMTWLKKIGIVLLCYLFGMIVGNIGILPESFTVSADGGDSFLSLLQSITICVALPMVLFSLDLKKWFKNAKKGMLCMLLATISVTAVTLVIHLAFGQKYPDSPQFAAAACAVYTGGTVNLGSIRQAIGMTANNYVIFNTYDSVISVLYVFFLSTVGRKFFLKVFRMKPYEKVVSTKGEEPSEDRIDESVYAYREILRKKNVPGLIGAFFLSVVIFIISYALNMAASKIDSGLGMAIMMLSITTLGIAASFIKRIREIKRSFQLGMYIIYVFCFSVAASADFRALINFKPIIFIYVSVGIIGSLLLHALLSKLFKIDTDTMIITSTSAICSPPFVPAVAAALNNTDILISGLATGVVGYAIGNYLGIAINYLYQLF